MGLFRSLRSACAVLFRRQRFEDGVSDELRFHIDSYAEDLVRRGMSPTDALRRARLELGSTEALKEELRAARGQRLLDELWQDTRYSVRRLRRSRVPAVVAVLALGIGVNLSVFSVIHASLLRPLPHPEPDRLVAISSRNIESGREHLTAPLDFFDFERRASSFARLAAYYPPGFTLTGGEQAERVSGARASSGIFDVLGVQPALGRGFLLAEDRAGAPPVAVISHALWMRRYHGDGAAVGQPIVLSGRPYTLVGVLPEGFHSPAMWPRMPEVWVPLGLDPNVGRRDARMLRVIGRLRPDVTVDRARAELDVLANALAIEYPDTNKGTGATAADMLAQLTRDVRPVFVCPCRGGCRAPARRLRERVRIAHRGRARAPARVRHAARARRQPLEDRSTDRGGEPPRRAARGRGRVRDGAVGERLSRRRGRRRGCAAGLRAPHRFDDVRRRRDPLACVHDDVRLRGSVRGDSRARSARRWRHPRHDSAARSGPSRAHRYRGRALAGPSRRRCAPHTKLLRPPAHAPRVRGRSGHDDQAVSPAGSISCGTYVGRLLRSGRRTSEGAARRRQRIGRGLASGERVRGERIVPADTR